MTNYKKCNWTATTTIVPIDASTYVHSSLLLQNSPVFGSTAGVHFISKDLRVQRSITLRNCVSIDSEVSDALLAITPEECVRIDPRSEKTNVGTWKGSSKKDYTAMTSVHEGGPDYVILGTTTTVRGSGREEEGVVEVWDARKVQVPLHSYAVHAGDVTSLSFTPYLSESADKTKRYLLSGATDGLVHLIDPTIADEEDCILHTVNAGVSVAQALFTTTRGKKDVRSKKKRKLSHATRGEGLGNLLVRTDIESIGQWKFLGIGPEEEGEKELNEGGFVVDEECKEVRREGVVDYVVQLSDSSESMFVGSNSGDFRRTKLPFSSIDNDEDEHEWIFQKGHEDVVRTVLYDDKSDMCLSGGEDGKIICWRRVDDS